MSMEAAQPERTAPHKLPDRLKVAVALLGFGFALFVYYITRFTVLHADGTLAWPITDQLTHPSSYSPHDLLIQAGLSGNFFLYRLLALVPFCRDNCWKLAAIAQK